ncbi:MAG: hypothetical protein FWG37_05360 [Clostridia bacterium]|nr:hypothetical protein [Clostridia bacterium]
MPGKRMKHTKLVRNRPRAQTRLLREAVLCDSIEAEADGRVIEFPLFQPFLLPRARASSDTPLNEEASQPLTKGG